LTRVPTAINKGPPWLTLAVHLSALSPLHHPHLLSHLPHLHLTKTTCISHPHQIPHHPLISPFTNTHPDLHLADPEDIHLTLNQLLEKWLRHLQHWVEDFKRLNDSLKLLTQHPLPLVTLLQSLPHLNPHTHLDFVPHHLEDFLHLLDEQQDLLILIIVLNHLLKPTITSTSTSTSLKETVKHTSTTFKHHQSEFTEPLTDGSIGLTFENIFNHGRLEGEKINKSSNSKRF
jgi:hypothetical protein